MSYKRESVRVKDANEQKVLDGAARERRLMKALAALEQDNHHDDPHENLDDDGTGPKFEDTHKNKRRKKLKNRLFKRRFRKNFLSLIEDEEQHFTKDQTNYLTAQVPPSQYPPRHLCAVCEFPSNYTCVQCGARYCYIKCFGVHKDVHKKMFEVYCIELEL